MDVRPRSRGDNRALRREFRSRSPQECGAHADPDACGGVPRNLGKLGRPIAISLRPAPNQSRFPGLQRSHSQNLHFARTSRQCGKDGGGHGYIAALCRKSARSGTPPSRKVKSPALSLQEKRRDKGRGPLHLHRFVVTRLILTPAPDPASSSPPSKIHRYSRHSPGCRACRTSRPFRSNFCGWRS
jgi:hypothetical protein